MLMIALTPLFGRNDDHHSEADCITAVESFVAVCIFYVDNYIYKNLLNIILYNTIYSILIG